MPSMKTEIVESDESFCKVVHYLHANPVHHGFVKNVTDWPHSSYYSLIGEDFTKINRNYVLEVFGGYESFMKYHQQEINLKNKWIDE